MQSRLTLNIQVSYVQNWQATLSFLKQLNPHSVVACIDNMNAANRLTELSIALPDTIIIGRFVFNGDGGMHTKPQAAGDNRQYVVSPTDALNAWGTLGMGKNRMLYFANEPQVTGASAEDIQRLINHTLETIDLANKRGIALCIGNYGVGHTLTPAFDTVIKALSNFRQHAIGIHCYTPADLKSNLEWIASRHIPSPRIQVTEFGFDAANGGDSLNGYKSRGMSGGDFAEWQTQQLQTLYKGYISSGILESLATFTWGNDASWHNFNVENDSGWQGVILNNAQRGLLSVIAPSSPPIVTISPVPTPAPVLQVGALKALRASLQVSINQLDSIIKEMDK